MVVVAAAAKTVENRILFAGERRGHIEAVDRRHRGHWRWQRYW